ncbi:putative endoglucanase [Metarhizium anisopliae]|nr:putative endoglucanase [Metarhizium anisopliae]
MKSFSYAFAVLSAASFAAGHMQMKYPPPLRSGFNKFTTDQDYDMTSPMDPRGSNFPCRGGLKVIDSSQGKPVDEWTAGLQYNFTITGGAWHKGGSCQASLSYDKGSTFKVIKSFEGSCPQSPGDTSYEFKVPEDAPAGDCVFSWSWFNFEGNREMYQNCAVVTIKADSRRKKRGTAMAMSQRPDMFVANVGNGCSTTEGTDLKFPQPGPVVAIEKGANLKGPVGNCQKPAPGGDNPTEPAPSASSAPAPTSDRPTVPSPSKPAPTNDKPTVPAPSKPAPTNDKPSIPSPSAPSKPTSTPSKPSPSKISCTGGKFPGDQNKPAQPPSTGAEPPVQPEPTSTSTPGDNNDVCTPGAYACTPDNSAWQICVVTQVWVVSIPFPISLCDAYVWNDADDVISERVHAPRELAASSTSRPTRLAAARVRSSSKHTL